MRRVALLLLFGACSVTSEPTSFDAPSPQEFARVSNMLHARCGTLDCHGHPARNLRIYGENGLRLSSDDVSGARQTTPAEHSANYASLLALEPEAMQAVFRDAGRDPERLTLVRKARNAEAHKGGRALDDSGDRCLLSWLEGSVDAQACFDGSVLPKPPGFPGAGGSGAAGGSGGSSGSGGAGGSGGSGATGGSAGLGGSGGSSATGGSGGSGGVTCGLTDFWPCTYDEACVPIQESPADHDAYASVECLTCHGAAGPANEYMFAGVAWNPFTQQGAPHIEVAVRDGATFHYACTDARGFFYVPITAGPAPNWLVTETRMRAELGEKIMPNDKEHLPTCNSSDCHGHVEHPLYAPL